MDHRRKLSVKFFNFYFSNNYIAQLTSVNTHFLQCDFIKNVQQQHYITSAKNSTADDISYIPSIIAFYIDNKWQIII